MNIALLKDSLNSAVLFLSSPFFQLSDLFFSSLKISGSIFGSDKSTGL